MRIKMIGTVIIFGLALSCSGEKHNIVIEGTISEDYTLSSGTVYLFSNYGRDTYLIDSVSIVLKDRSFCLAGNLPLTDYSYLVIPPRSYLLELTAGEHVHIDITPGTSFYYPDAKGSALTAERYEKETHNKILRDRKNKMETELFSGNLTQEERSVLEAELEELRYELNVGWYLKEVATTRSPPTFRRALAAIKREADGRGRVTNGTYDSLVKVMKVRFPDDLQTQLYPDPLPGPSQESQKVSRMRSKLLGLDVPDVEIYSLLDKVEPIFLPSVEGNDIALEDMTTEYVLIDFWASWCTSCRDEIPGIKKALDKYGNRLSVYAVSLDKNEDQWKKAIEQDESHTLTHVLLGDADRNNYILARFGVGSIPANYLLDADRRIIATYIRGEQLMDKIKELTE